MAGTSWTVFRPGRIMNASQVNANFDYCEGDILPHTGGDFTDGAYLLGSSTYRFKGVNTYAFSPSSTTDGIAMGQATADTSAALDLSAMQKALYFPVMTTAVRDALTPQSGFVIYNSTTGFIERYEGGQWINMNSPIGIKAKKVVYTTADETATAVYATVLDTSGSGRLLSCWAKNIANTNSSYNHYTSLRITIDGSTISSDTKLLSAVNTDTHTAFYRRDPRANTTSSLRLYADTHTNVETVAARFEALDLSFKSSILIETKIEAQSATAYPSTDACGVLYEIS